MSSLWFNLRILWWHFQITKGYLFRVRVSFNSFHWFWRGLRRPIWFHEFSPRVGWQERNSDQWRAYDTGVRCE